MALFLSTFENKVDSKGMVSVPSQFRGMMCGKDFSGVVIYESSNHKCIEGCTMERMQKLSEVIDDLDPSSREKDAFAAIILGGAAQLPFDSDGRVILPKSLMGFAGIKDKAVFIGKGQTFEIWEPEMFNKYLEEARKQIKDNPFSIKKLS